MTAPAARPHRHPRIPRPVWSIVCALVLLVVTTVPLAFGAGSAAAAETSPSITKVVDPDTSAGWRDALATDTLTTEDAGRIWADKTVFATGSALDGALGVETDLADDTHGFAVALSAMATAASVRTESDAAHDVVFVVSTTSVLGDLTYANRPEAAWLVDALNTAIARLMDDTPTGAARNRVAVVGYAAEVATIMPLATWEPDNAGDYLAYTPKQGSTPGSIACTATSTDGAAGSSASLTSGSYLQRAVAVAGDILTSGATDGRDGRTADIVVMSPDTPPMANVEIADPPAYTSDTTGFLGPLPNTRENGYGTDAMLTTLLTMRHVRRAVEDAYGVEATDIYTVGLDTSATVAWMLETSAEQAVHALPGTGAAAGVDLAENLAQAAEAYAQAAATGSTQVALDLYGSSSGGLVAEQVTLPVVPGLVDQADGYALGATDEYLSAHSAKALTWTFTDAVDRVLDIAYDAPATGEEVGRERMTLVDELASGMEVSRMGGIVYGDTVLDGGLAAQAIATSFSDPFDFEATHEFQYLIDTLNDRYDLGMDAYGLFSEALADGQVATGATPSSKASWYVDAHHLMVPGAGTPYRFATQAEIDAIVGGTWQDSPVAATIEAARAAGATAVCETYFYIGNLENQYTGGDETLYDFVVMVECDLATGDQELLLSIPVEAVPARRLDVLLSQGGEPRSITVANPDASPVRLVYSIAPKPAAEAALARVEAGEHVTSAELEAAGLTVASGDMGVRRTWASAFAGTGDAAAALTVANALAAPTNTHYLFGTDTPLFTLRPGVTFAEGATPGEDDVTPLEDAPAPGDTCYTLHTWYEQVGGAVQKVSSYEPFTIPEDADTASWPKSDTGQAMVPAGTPRHDAVTTLKSQNATASAPAWSALTLTRRATGGELITVHLGNNGALVLPPAAGTGSLSVTKHVLDASQAGAPVLDGTSERFPITVTLTDALGDPLTGTVTPVIERAGDTRTLDPLALEGGTFTVSLAGGETLTVSGIPVGTSWHVAEEDVSATGWLALAENVSGTIAEDPSQARLTNVHLPDGSLGIGKICTGNAPEEGRTFAFSVTVEDMFPGGGTDTRTLSATRFVGTSTTPTTLTFTRAGATAGVATIEGIGAGSGILIDGLPKGAAFTVEELAADDLARDGYTVRSGSAAALAANDTDALGDTTYHGTIAEAGITDVYVVNERNLTGELTVSDTVEGALAEADAASGRRITYTVHVTDATGAPVTGVFPYRTTGEAAGATPTPADGWTGPDEGTVVLVDGTTMLEIGGTGTITIEGLPAGGAVTVTQEDLASLGYTTTPESLTVEDGLAPGGLVASFVNRKDTEPDTPVDPGTPEEPDTPVDPGTPDTPNTPDTPDTPNVPGTPETDSPAEAVPTPDHPHNPGTASPDTENGGRLPTVGDDAPGAGCLALVAGAALVATGLLARLAQRHRTSPTHRQRP